MALSEAEVQHVALLARMDLTDAEVAELAPQLSKILAYAEQVSEVAAADVPPMTHPYPLENVFREDMLRPSLPRDLILAMAPQVEDDRFVVPQIVADES